MKTQPLTDTLEHLRGKLQKQGCAAADAQLLTRYLLDREEQAFETILEKKRLLTTVLDWR